MTGAWGVRGDRRRILLAVAAVSVLVVVAMIALWPRGSAADADAESAASHHPVVTPTVAPIAAGTEALAVDMSEAVPVEPPAQESAGNAEQSSLAAAAAEPHERDGTADLGEERADVDPADVIDPDAALGGCHPAYGETGQCLPTIPPSMAAHVAEMEAAGLDVSTMPHAWTCSEVALYFPDGLAVRVPGTDPDGLDADGDGIACEPET